MKDEVVVLETNLDDCTGEQMGYAMDLLFQAGARDVWYTPIYMKKNRPAYALSVICKPEVEEDLVRIIFRHTSAIGMRRSVKERIIMDREATTVETPYGTLDAKKCTYGDIEKVTVEYESAKKIAEEQQIPLDELYKY